MSDAERAEDAATIAELRAEVERLRRWKAEATEVILGLQDLGKALGLPLGASITGPVAVDAAKALQERLWAVRELAERWLSNATIDRDIPHHFGRELMAVLTRD